MASGADPARGESPRRRKARAVREPAGPDPDELESLRELLLGPERARLSELEGKPLLRDLEPDDVSPVLARALDQSRRRDGELGASLTPAVEEAIERSAGRDPDVLARAFAPVVGRALRRAARAALARPASYVPWAVGAGLLLAAVVLFVRISDARAREQARWAELARRLDDEPGIVVVAVDDGDGRRVVRGLADPGAADPRALAAERGFADELASGALALRFEPYHSLEPPFVLGRARELLDPPPEVALEVVDGRLALSGRAPAPWIRRARELAPSLSGVEGLDVERLVDLDLEECWRLQERLDGEKVLFPEQGVEIDPGLADWSDLADDFARLDAAAWRAGVAVVVELAPEIVPVERGRGLGLERTRAVKARLEELPRRATLVRALADEKIVGYLNGGPKGKLPRVVLRVTLPGADRPSPEPGGGGQEAAPAAEGGGHGPPEDVRR